MIKKIMLVFVLLATAVFGRDRYSGGTSVTASSIKDAISASSNGLIVYPDDDLQAAYDWLKSSDRNASMGVLSANNRRTLVLAAGIYPLTTTLILDTDYVDISELSVGSVFIVDGNSLDVQVISYGNSLTDVVVTPSFAGVRIPYDDLVKPDKLLGPEDVSGDMVIDANFGDIASDPYYSTRKWSMNDITAIAGTRFWYGVGAGFTKSTDPNHYITASNGIEIDWDSTIRELTNAKLDRWHGLAPTIGTNDVVCHLKFFVHSGGSWPTSSTGTLHALVSDHNDRLDGADYHGSARSVSPGIALMGYYGSIRSADSGFATVSLPFYNALPATTYTAEANLANPLAYFKLKTVNDTGLEAIATLDSIWWTKDLFRANNIVGGAMIFMDDCVDGPGSATFDPANQQGEFLDFCKAASDCGVKLILPIVDFDNCYTVFTYPTEADILKAISMGHEIILHDDLRTLRDLDPEADGLQNMGSGKQIYDHFRRRQQWLIQWGRSHGLDLTQNAKHYLCHGNLQSLEAIKQARKCFTTFWGMHPNALISANIYNTPAVYGITPPMDAHRLGRYPAGTRSSNSGSEVRVWAQNLITQIIGNGHACPVYMHRIKTTGDGSGSYDMELTEWKTLMRFMSINNYKSWGCEDLVANWKEVTK